MQNKTVEVDGRVFEYNRITFAKADEIKAFFREKGLLKDENSSAVYTAKKKHSKLFPYLYFIYLQITKSKVNIVENKYWNEIIGMAIKKNFLWQCFGIIPKELRYENIDIKVAGGLEACFFGDYRATMEEYGKLMQISQDSN